MAHDERRNTRWREGEDLLQVARDQARGETDFFAMLEEEVDHACVHDLAVAGDDLALGRWLPKVPSTGLLQRWNAMRAAVNARCARAVSQTQRSRPRASRAGCAVHASVRRAPGGRNSA
jgi:hypothetical protein